MKTTLFILILLIGLAGTAMGDVSLDVSPTRVQIQVQPGAEYTNALTILNSGDDPVRLRAYVEDWYLDEVGTPVFQPVGAQQQTASIWIESAPSDFLLEPGKTEYVRFTVKIPEDAQEGGYHGSLLLETVPLNRAELKRNQVFVRGRIACMMYVTVGEPPKAARITALQPVQRGRQKFVRIQVENTGDDFIRLAGDLTFSAEGNPLADPVVVPDVPILPGCRRWLELELPAEAVGDLAVATIKFDLPGIGVLLGECSLSPEQVILAQ